MWEKTRFKDIIDTMTTCRELIANKTLEVAIRIKDAPTIDAVPVVRCKDCVFRNKNLMWIDERSEKCYCSATDIYVTDEFYCAYGKEKEDATD